MRSEFSYGYCDAWILSFKEFKKVLLYFPLDVEMDVQIRHAGLLEAVTKFIR